jgi:hypothetical protein
LHAFQLVVRVAVQNLVCLLLGFWQRLDGAGMALLLRHNGGGNLAREPWSECPAVLGQAQDHCDARTPAATRARHF